MAQTFSRLGSKVTIIERASQLLNREDDEVSKIVMDKFNKEGIDILISHTASHFEQKDGKKIIYCIKKDGEKEEEVAIEFDQVLVALGRKANTSGFGLEELDIEISDRGTIVVDEYLRTKYPNIYACGDVAGPYQFTHTAAHQAWYASVNALFSPLRQFKADYRVIPWTTFTDPEVARVGLSEKDAKKQNIPYEVTVYGIDDLDRAIADQEAHGFYKSVNTSWKR